MAYKLTYQRSRSNSIHTALNILDTFKTNSDEVSSAFNHTPIYLAQKSKFHLFSH